MKKTKKRKGMDHSQMRCPYCKSPVVLRSADGIYKENSKGAMLYVCAKYPQCDSYVHAHTGSMKPMGSLANQELRTLRQKAHQSFDRLYLSGLMTREEAYLWLANEISAPLSEAHIGHLGEYYCRQVIKRSKELLDMQEKRTRNKRVRKYPAGMSLCPENKDKSGKGGRHYDAYNRATG